VSTKIDRALCRTLAAEVEAALKTVAERHGLTVAYAGGSFDASTYRPKITFAAVSDTGRPADWDAWCHVYGFKPEDFGRAFKNAGNTFTVAGLDGNRPKYPVIAVRADGKRFKFSAESVVALLARAAA